MKVLPFLILCSGVFIGCRTETPTDAFQRMQRTAQPFYTEYMNGSPEVSLAAIQKVEHLADTADSKAWVYMDRDCYMAIIDARVCLAFERLGRTNDAASYRKMAVHHFQRHKEYNSEYHEMLPVTPSPSVKDAEKELFFMVGKLDEHARQGRGDKSP